MTSSLTTIAQLRQQIDRLQQKFVSTLLVFIFHTDYQYSNASLQATQQSVLDKTTSVRYELDQEQQKVSELTRLLQEKDEQIATLTKAYQVCHIYVTFSFISFSIVITCYTQEQAKQIEEAKTAHAQELDQQRLEFEQELFILQKTFDAD